MITTSDRAAAVSTIFETWFLESFNNSVVITEGELGRLVQTIDIGDNEGDQVRIDWLGGVPALREWVDEKRAQVLNPYNWTVAVKDFEATIRIRLNTLNDARFNIYKPRIQGMAINAARHWYDLISALIAAGSAAVCYDGQYFFDTDHAEGASGNQSNKLTGTGTSTAQVRSDYFAAKAALMKFKDDKGYPIWVGDFRPLIWAPASGPIMDAFESLRSETQLASNQSNNTLKDKFDIVYDPKLADLTDWYMFNPDTPLRPFVALRREPIHYVDNFGGGNLANPDVWASRIGEAGVEGRDNIDYAMWQAAVQTTNA